MIMASYNSLERFFRLSTRKHEGRHKDVGLEDYPHLAR
jgi:hypothetical protein